MSARYSNTFYSIGGDQYKIEIHDSAYSSTVTLFETEKSGYKISYRALSQRNDPVFASDCTVAFWVQNADEENFIIEMAQADEEQFGVKIYKNNNVIWLGILAQDQIELEDKYYPYQVNLKFMDGLGRLSDKFYNVDGTETSTNPLDGRQSVIKHIITCLSFAGTAQYTASDATYLKAVMAWYEINHVEADNRSPLSDTNIDHQAFYSIDENGKYTWMTAGDVLTMILQEFNCRIFMYNGVYHVFQTQEYEHATVKSWWFDKAALQLGYSLTDANYRMASTALVRGSEGVWKFMPPLRDIKKVYKFRIASGDGGNLLPVQTSYETQVDFTNSLQSANQEKLHFTGSIYESVSVIDLTAGTTYAVYKMKVILTAPGQTYYLSGTNFAATWTTNASDFVEIHGSHFQDPIGGTASKDIDFFTDNIPANGTCTFEFDKDHYHDGANLNKTLHPGVTWDYVCNHFSMKMDGLYELSGERKFTAFNEYHSKSTQRIEVKETAIGDKPYDYSIGRLMAYDGADWHNTSHWGPSGYDINQLSLIENLNGQMAACKVFQGTFIGAATPEKAITWDGLVLVPLQLEYSPAEDKVTGRWFNVIPVSGATIITPDPDPIAYTEPPSISPDLNSGYLNGQPLDNAWGHPVRGAVNQIFTATEGQTVFEVTDFTLNDYYLPFIDNALQDRSLFTRLGNTLTCAIALSANQKLLITD